MDALKVGRTGVAQQGTMVAVAGKGNAVYHEGRHMLGMNTECDEQWKRKKKKKENKRKKECEKEKVKQREIRTRKEK